MRRLRDFQRVDIYAGEASVPCRVATVSGDEARLQLTAPLPREAGTLPAGCQLAFDHSGHLIMLSGTLYPDDELTVRFVVGDGVRASDKRRHARLSIPLPATVTPIDATGAPLGPPVSCLTKDISAGGALLSAGGMPSRVRLSITLPGALGVIDTHASVVRCTDEVTACAFIALEVERRQTIEDFVATVRDELARRFAAQAAA